MIKLSRTTEKLYLESNHFVKLNKVVFLWLFVFYIMQTMAYNALFDLPQLILILVCIAFFAFRKSFPIQFNLLNFFIAYFFQFSLMVKLVTGIAMKVDFIKEYLSDNPEAKISVFLQVLFGDSKNLNGDALMRRSYQFDLLMCVYLA
jgi:hypothetical protein